MRLLASELLSRFKELAAFINDISRDLLALPFAVLFKPCASAEKGSAHQIIIFTVPTIGSVPAVVIIIGFHACLITKCHANVNDTQEQILFMSRNL